MIAPADSRHSFSGTAMDLTRHVPCPFCQAPDFFVFKVRDLTYGAVLAGPCRECGRSASTRIRANESIQWTQIPGPD